MKRLPLLALLLICATPAGVRAADGALLPRPPGLEPAVQFWIRVYTRITTGEGFIHDQQDLSVVYETLRIDPDSAPRERERRVDAERTRIADILRRLGSGAEPANDEERRIRALWGDAPAARLRQAADDVRFQLGQADRFRAGLVRAGAWESHIAGVLANLGLPAELAALPHVESSFDPAAYSKVGAAGLWQFMRSTGRRFLRIDAAVDERLDPFRETEAAAQLLAYDYRLLGSWPLAITAYNHGAEGMRRARDQLGTDDIVRIVRDYHSPSFGFASRNFYASFLAALTISEDPAKYFGDLKLGTEQSFHEVKLASAADIGALVRTLAVDRTTLRALNPALRPPVWSGRRPVPRGYRLRLPAADSRWTEPLLAERLHAAEPLVAAAERGNPPPQAAAEPVRARAAVQPPVPRSAGRLIAVSLAAPLPAVDWPAARPVVPDIAAGLPYYVVRDGDTVEQIASGLGVPVAQLLALNGMRDQDDLYEGQRLRLAAAQPLPEPAPAAETDTAAAPPDAANAGAAGAGNAALEQDTADPEDYSVAADGSIRVVAAETLGHYADWLGVSTARLRALNRLHGRTPVLIGRRLRLVFDTVTRERFEQRRRDYHAQLQAAFFASHRITGSGVYVARRGDSLWTITQHSALVPIWLLQQYNPDLDFGNLRPGTQISLPRVEEVSGT